MSIVVYEQVNDFYESYKEKILQKEAVMQLLVANISAHAGESCTPECLFGASIGYYGTILFCNCHPFHLVVCSICEVIDKEAVKELAIYLKQNRVPISGILANKYICNTFIKMYTNKNDMMFKENLAMDIMVLKQLTPIKLADGRMRKAGIKDIALIAEWEVAFAKEALGEEYNVQQRIDHVKRKVDLGMIFLFENSQGKVVSMVDAARKLRNGVVFNDVYTPKEERGKGYAQTNMYYASEQYLKLGKKFCTLFVDKKNPISNKVYKNIGFEIVEDAYDYRIL